MTEICEYLGADSLGYLDVEAMVRATGREQARFCLACFNGNYPLPGRSDARQIHHGKSRGAGQGPRAECSRPYSGLKSTRRFLDCRFEQASCLPGKLRNP